MADFKTHIGGSTVVGIGYAVWGYSQGVPLPVAALAGGLCSIAGMLPDLDSDTGRPAREMFPFVAAVVPALMLERFRQWELGNEWIAVATGFIYLFIRFVVGNWFKRYTVHRGMWHSVPACLIAGLLTFLLCPKQELMLRLYLSVAVMVGFTVHLVLDEIWSVNVSTLNVSLKNSWGTALKFYGKNAWSNLLTYSQLVLFTAAAIGDPMLMEQLGYDAPYNTREVKQNTHEYLQDQLRSARRYLDEPPTEDDLYRR
jgi:hypothetical protein